MRRARRRLERQLARITHLMTNMETELKVRKLKKEAELRALFQGRVSKRGLIARLREAEAHNQRLDQTGAWHAQHFPPPASPSSPIEYSAMERRARVMEFASRNPGVRLRQREPSPPSDDGDILVIDEEVVLEA